jgi:hypothetical protein
MARVGNAESRGAVNVLVSINVNNGCVACRFPKERKIFGEIRDVTLFVAAQTLR